MGSDRIVSADEAREMAARYAARPRGMTLVLGDRLCVVVDLDTPTERTIATLADDDVGRPVESSEHVAAAEAMAHAADDVDALARTVVALHAEVERMRAHLAAEALAQQSADDAATVAVERDAAEAQLAEVRAELARVTAERDALRAAVREYRDASTEAQIAVGEISRLVAERAAVDEVMAAANRGAAASTRAYAVLRALVEAQIAVGESGGDRG